MAGAAFGEVQVSFFVAGAVLGEVQVLLFGQAHLVKVQCHCSWQSRPRDTFRGRRSIWRS